MKIVCAWCGKTTGEKEPLEDKSVTHGICEKCLIKNFPHIAEKVAEVEKQEGEPIEEAQARMMRKCRRCPRMVHYMELTIEGLCPVCAEKEQQASGSSGNPAPKEPWQMTREEYVKSAREWRAENMPRLTGRALEDELEHVAAGHKRIVQNALAAGKLVPAEVLADYPDLLKGGNPMPVEIKFPSGHIRGSTVISEGELTQKPCSDLLNEMIISESLEHELTHHGPVTIRELSTGTQIPVEQLLHSLDRVTNEFLVRGCGNNLDNVATSLATQAIKEAEKEVFGDTRKVS